MILYSVIVTLLAAVLGFTTWNLLRKNEYAENYIANLLLASDAAISNMRELDKLGAFESDDETGVTFRALLAVVEDYADIIGFPPPSDITEEIQPRTAG